MLRQWLRSADHAIEGVLHAARHERHMRYHFYSAAVVLVVAYALGVNRTEFVILTLAAMAVILAEMLNSAIEAAVDLVSPEQSEKARAAKDVAAGGVLLTSFGAAMVGYIVMIPYVRVLLSGAVGPRKHPLDEITVMAMVIVLMAVVLLKAYTGKGHPLSGGMPSGHAALAFSLWVSISYGTQNYYVSGVCLALAAAVAISRVSRGVHRFAEVLAGALLGAGITFALFVALA